MERDVAVGRNYNKQGDFNSHAHVERDPKNRTEIKTRQNFNSHAHVERDALHGSFSQIPHISTHTLTWSVTDAFIARLRQTEFQLTRSRGA